MSFVAEISLSQNNHLYATPYITTAGDRTSDLLVAMIDRLAHHGYLVKHTGASYRLAHSLMRG